VSGKAVVLISHKASSLRQVATRIAVMSGGRIIEVGTDQELSRMQGQYARMRRRYRAAAKLRRRTTGSIRATVRRKRRKPVVSLKTLRREFVCAVGGSRG